jgi:hypothetical protein
MSLVLEPEKMFLRAMKGENAGGEQLEPAVLRILTATKVFPVVPGRLQFCFASTDLQKIGHFA